MKFLKETYLKDPSAGSRSIASLLEMSGKSLNRKRIQRMRREMGIRAIYCQPRTSIPNKTDQKYPYLLRKLMITRSNQVWCTDITYVPMPRGHVYLCCIFWIGIHGKCLAGKSPIQWMLRCVRRHF